jgi:seryl-tRNA synthetase
MIFLHKNNLFDISYHKYYLLKQKILKYFMGILHRTTDFDRLIGDAKRRGCEITENAVASYRQLNQKNRQLDKLLTQRKNLTEELRNGSTRNENNLKIARELKDQIGLMKNEVRELTLVVKKLDAKVPNYLDARVPNGKTAEDNELVSQWGEFFWNGVHHYEMEKYYSPAKKAGARMSVFKGDLAILWREASRFCLQELNKAGFQECILPEIFPEDHFIETGHYGDPSQTLFEIKTKPKEPRKFLIPTSEVSLLSQIPKKLENFPLKLCSRSSCFRREAGAAGRDTRGMIRNHQFGKVEMVVGTNAETSKEMHWFLVETASNILKKLNIPHRIMRLCAGDIGNGAEMTYDIEVPIGNKWVEVASISNCGTYQAIGLGLKDNRGNYLHTLNGTGMSMRICAAILEKNYDPGTKTFHFPKALCLVEGK